MGAQTELERKTAQRPPRRWRNRYWLTRLFISQSGRRYGPGFQLGLDVWPSREIAEERARESVAGREDFVTYLGAAPAPEE